MVFYAYSPFNNCFYQEDDRRTDERAFIEKDPGDLLEPDQQKLQELLETKEIVEQEKEMVEENKEGADADDKARIEPQIQPEPEVNPRFKNSFNEVVNLPTLVFDRHTTKLSVKVIFSRFKESNFR